MSKQFGGKVTSQLKDRYKQSKNWKDNAFVNLEETSMNFSFHSIPKLLYKQFFENKGRIPAEPLPVTPFDQAAFLEDSPEPKFIWYGHSALLLRWMGKTILIDPMLGPNASPIAPIATKRFSQNTLDLIDQFPPIDLLLMTHDHYDHLDYDSIKKLRDKTSQWFVALGIGRHLESWGIASESIREFDWWDHADFASIRFTFTPSRHFSGRGLNDRAKSLWGGWAMNSSGMNLYWSGDGGYGDHFKEVGEKLGPFDLGFMECGQYNENWHLIHMYPEESIEAAKDARVTAALPVHWAGFALAQHHWKDPIERFVSEAEKQSVKHLTPAIGEITTINSITGDWWSGLK